MPRRIVEAPVGGFCVSATGLRVYGLRFLCLSIQAHGIYMLVTLVVLGVGLGGLDWGCAMRI